MTEQEEFEFRLRLEKEQQAAKPQEPSSQGIMDKVALFNPVLYAISQAKNLPENLRKIVQDPQKNIPEALLASAPVRFATNAGKGILGLSQLRNKAIESIPVVGKPISDVLNYPRKALGIPNEAEIVKTIDERINQAREASGDTGIDIPGIAGRIMDPVNLSIGKALPLTGGLGARTLKSGLMGAGIGAATPVENNGDFGTEKLKQIGIGAATAAPFPLVTDTLKYTFGPIGGLINDISNAISKEGPKRLAKDAIITNLGEQNIKPVADKLLAGIDKSQRIVGDRPTAADLVRKMPEGSPIDALQKITFKTGGGPSVDAGKRVLHQQEVVSKAKDLLNERMGPIRERILGNAAVGNKARNLVEGIDDLLNKSAGHSAKEQVLNHVKSKILDVAKSGNLTGQSLHNIRMNEINAKISELVQASRTNKRSAIEAAKEVRSLIDNVIETSGGRGWSRWLDIYSKQASKIDSVANRLKDQPVQRTAITAGNLSRNDPEFAKILSRPVVVANWLLNKATGGKEAISTKMHKELAKYFLDPASLGKMLSEPKTGGEIYRTLNQAGYPLSIYTTKKAGE